MRCLDANFKKLSNVQVEALVAKLKDLQPRLSSACSGSGVAEIVHHAILARAGLHARVDFACEKHKAKRTFLKTIMERKLCKDLACEEMPCLFEDVMELNTGRATCAMHPGGLCNVKRRSDVFVCGFSCKTLSSLNSSFKGPTRDCVLSAQLGSSGSTFKGLTDHASEARPRIIILENVLEMTKEGSPNVEYLWDSMHTIGFAGASQTFRSVEFAMPQGRVRAYFLLFDMDAYGYTKEAAKEKAQQILDGACRFKGQHPEPLHRMLLDSTSSRVVKELARKAASATGERAADWRQFHKIHLKKQGYGLRHTLPPREMETSPWYEVLPKREQHCLGFVVARATATGDNLTTCDIAPRIDRLAIGTNGIVPTLTGTTKNWIFPAVGGPEPAEGESKSGACKDVGNRLMLGYEMMGLQAWPIEWFDKEVDDFGITDPLMADLAGNAFTATVVAAIMMSLYAGMDKPKEIPPMDFTSIDRAEELLRS